MIKKKLILTTSGLYIFSLFVNSTISLRFFSAAFAFFLNTHGGVFDASEIFNKFGTKWLTLCKMSSLSDKELQRDFYKIL